jgi:hypothetical protein
VWIANKIAGTSARASPATPRKRKTAGEDGTPSKKRAVPNKTMKNPGNDFGNGMDGLPDDMDEFSA